MTVLYNAHVQKWCRWQHWLAAREGRWFGMAFWAAWHDDEVRSGGCNAETK